MTDNNAEFESQKIGETTSIKRRSHDIVWLILFILVQIGMVVVLVFTSKYGSIDRYEDCFNYRLRYGTDSLGNYCGTLVRKDSQMDLADEKYLYWFDFSNTSSYKRCLESCPKSISLICKYGVGLSNSSDQEVT